MKLDIITQTDFAGAIEKTYHCPGAAKVAGLIQTVRNRNPQGTLVLDAGDVLCAAPIVNLTDGRGVIGILNQMGVDAMTLGNHEFDNGREYRKNALSAAEFPVLCANILESDGSPVGLTHVILQRQGVRIGVIGVTTEYTPYMVRADMFTDFQVKPAAQVLQTLIPQVRQQADVVVILSHLPCNPDGTGELFETLAQIPEVDVFIGGHNLGYVSVIQGNTAVVKAGFSAGYMGHITLTLDENKKVTDRHVRVYDMMALDFPPAPQIQGAVDEVMAPFRPQLDEVLTHNPRRQDVDSARECVLGNVYTDGLRAAAGAEIAFFNATSIFGFMPAGPVTTEMVRHVMCFDESIYEGMMTGRQLRALLERTYEEDHWSKNYGIQISGFRAVVDTRLPAGSRVVSITRPDGTPIRDEDLLKAATTDYIALGGNDYREITGQVAWQDSTVTTHAFYIGYFRSLESLPETTEGRLQNRDTAWK